jgi:hypothetical protein
MSCWRRFYKITPGNTEMQALLLSIIGQLISRKILLNYKKRCNVFLFEAKPSSTTVTNYIVEIMYHLR